MLNEIIQLTQEDVVYCLGDYIDRGTRSEEVIDLIIELRSQGYQLHTLRGNHEQMLLSSGKDSDAMKLWLNNGGDKTLSSFGIQTVAELGSRYLDFFHQTKFYFQTNDFIVVHAGLNFNIEDPFSDYESMLWIRDFWVDKNFLDGKVLIHGHTPLRRDILLTQDLDTVINLDGGCVFKNIPGYGSLFALHFETKELMEVRNID